MKNKKHEAIGRGSVILALAVAAGTKSGDLVALGSDGLYGIATTDRATTDTINKGGAAPGLVDGQASLYLPGIQITLDVPRAALNGIADYGKVYRTPAGQLTGTAAGNLHVGYKLGVATLGCRANG